MKIHIFNQQKDLKVSLSFFRKIIKEVIHFEGQDCQEVTVHFVDTQTICRLHDEFFDDPSTTDCISFPIDEDPSDSNRVLGEIFVCPETAITYASAHEANPLEETVLYVIHGLLHLMGYDDIKKNNRAQMRAAERRHLKHLEALNFVQKE